MGEDDQVTPPEVADEFNELLQTPTSTGYQNVAMQP